MTNIVHSTWPQIAVDPANPLEALRAVRTALESGRPIPKEYRAWLARGIATFERSPDGGLDRALGIVPKVGGRALSGVQHREKRNACIRTIGNALDLPSIAATATGVAQVINQKIAPGNAIAEQALRVLLDNHSDHLVGPVAIYQILATAPKHS